MVAEMNKVENAARLAMGDLGNEPVVNRRPRHLDGGEDHRTDRNVAATG